MTTVQSDIRVLLTLEPVMHVELQLVLPSSRRPTLH
jgi:hypothetical protein